MKKLIAIILVALMITSCRDSENEITISGEVAVVYTNGEKDTISLDEKFTTSTDTSKIFVCLTSNDGASCLVIGNGWGYISKACGVRKIQILNLKKKVKEL